MQRTTRHHHAGSAAAGLASIALVAIGCASRQDAADGLVEPVELEEAPFLGRWTSELDGATLAIESTGVFSIDVPSRTAEAARGAVGRWNWNGSEVSFTNLRDSNPCADVPGVYRAEVVRDTVRFTIVRDACAPREEHMAWPWRRPEDPQR